MIEKRSCEEEISMLGVTVGDFWAWAYSDLLNNTNRAVFAEFLVDRALRVTDVPRVPWDSVDLRYRRKRSRSRPPPTSRVGIGSRTLSPRSLSISRRGSLRMRRRIPTRSSRAGLQTATCSASTLRRSGVERTFWRWTGGSSTSSLRSGLNRELGSQKTAALSTISYMVGPVGYSQLKGSVDQVL